MLESTLLSKVQTRAFSFPYSGGVDVSVMRS